MIRSFITISLRILWRNKVTSLVNIAGLSIGITAFIFIMLYVRHETSYDKFNENYDRIYRLEGDDYNTLPPVIGTYLGDRLPEVQDITRLDPSINSSLSYRPESNPQDLRQVSVNHLWADSTIFKVFTLPFIAGDPATALREPMTTVITESTAKKLFGGINPMMKTIEFNGHEFMITGVMSDIHRSHVQIDALLSRESIPKVIPRGNPNNTAGGSWLWNATYLLMADEIDETVVEAKINKALAEINDGTVFDIKFNRFHIRPLKDIYFSEAVHHRPYALHANRDLIRVLMTIGIFLLIFAGINYVNLTTARSFIRLKEVAVKRLSGSSANLLRCQLIVESVIISLISLAVAVTMVQLFLPEFNNLAMTDIEVEDLKRPVVWGGIIAGGIVLGVLAGVYPAYYLTAIQPVTLMKGPGVSGTHDSIFRSGLMTFQFVLCIIMLVAIIVNFRQLHYVRNADLGFNKELVIRITTPSEIPNEFTMRDTFKDRLLQHHNITKVAFSAGGPGHTVPFGVIEIDGVKHVSAFIPIDEDYLDVMGIELSEGRAFSLDRPSDRQRGGRGGILVNEAAVRQFEIASPIGKMILRDDGSRPAEIIGIVKDFHFQPLHERIEPIYFLWYAPMLDANIKIASTNVPATLKIIEAEWKSVWGSRPFNYEFVDESLDRQYKADEQLANVIGYFTGLAVIIACLGLFALSSFMVSRRTKEIGICKTLGAPVATIYSMLSWYFLRSILLAAMIAIPVAWYVMQMWLETFAYHIALKADIFLIAALLATAIALMTVTWQSLRAANANPVKALRYE